MKRRYTDADKFDDEWYLSLTNDNRIIWEWMLAKCSTAGILKKNFLNLNFQCNLIPGKEVDEKKLLKIFEGRIIDLGKVFFIPKFVKFQNPSGLKSNKPVVVGIRNELLSYDKNIISQSLGNDYLIIYGKGKGKGNGEGKEKGKGKIFFVSIGTERFENKPSEIVNQHRGRFETLLMTALKGINETELLLKFDKEYSASEFNDMNHFFNSLKKIGKEILNPRINGQIKSPHFLQEIDYSKKIEL